MAATTSPDNISYPTSTDKVTPLHTWFANLANTTQAAVVKLRNELTATQTPITVASTSFGTMTAGWTIDSFSCRKVGKLVMVQASFTKSTDMVHGNTVMTVYSSYRPDAQGAPSFPLSGIAAPGGVGVGCTINANGQINVLSPPTGRRQLEIAGVWFIA